MGKINILNSILILDRIKVAEIIYLKLKFLIEKSAVNKIKFFSEKFLRLLES